MIHHADRLALGEAKRVFTNSGNVRDRLRRSLGIESDPLYHRSRLCEALLETEPGPYGDYVLFPSRLEPIKRQSLAVEAMRHVRSPVRLVLVGSGRTSRRSGARSRPLTSVIASSWPDGSRTRTSWSSTEGPWACTTGRTTRTSAT